VVKAIKRSKDAIRRQDRGCDHGYVSGLEVYREDAGGVLYTFFTRTLTYEW
jgi:hypothetical protein